MSVRHSLASIFLALFLAASGFAQGHGTGGHSTGGGIPSTNSSSTSRPLSTNSSSTGNVPLQTASDEGKLEFRTETILVQVPVVITDKSGNHLHGLTKDDFHVLENGKEQSVSAFEEIVATNAKIPAPPAKPGEFANLTLSEKQPREVTVVVLDTVNTPFLDQTYGRRELVKYLANNLDTSQVLSLMIITSHG